MSCDSIAVITAQIEGSFFGRLSSIAAVRARMRAFFEESPSLDPSRLIPPDPQAKPPRLGYSYYRRAVFIAISEAGSITIKAARLPKSQMEALGRGIKEAMEDEMARAMSQYMKKIAEAGGYETTPSAADPDGGYSFVIVVP